MCCRRSFAFGRRACLRLEPQRFNPAVEIIRRKPLNLSKGCLRPPVCCRRSFTFLAEGAKLSAGLYLAHPAGPELKDTFVWALLVGGTGPELIIYILCLVLVAPS